MIALSTNILNMKIITFASYFSDLRRIRTWLLSEASYLAAFNGLNTLNTLIDLRAESVSLFSACNKRKHMSNVAATTIIKSITFQGSFK